MHSAGDDGWRDDEPLASLHASSADGSPVEGRLFETNISGLDHAAEGLRPDTVCVGAPPSDLCSLVAHHESRLHMHQIRALEETLSDAASRAADLAARSFWEDSEPAVNAMGAVARAHFSVAQLLKHAVEVVEIRVQNEQLKPPHQRRRRLQVEQKNKQ